MSRTYEEIVTEAQGMESGRNWRLGDLALEVETSYGEGTLERFASDVDVEYEALRKYRYVASRFENGTRVPFLPWAVYRVFAAQDDRYELIKQQKWTVAEAQKFVARRRNVVSEAHPLLEKASTCIDSVSVIITNTKPDRASRNQIAKELKLLLERGNQLYTEIIMSDDIDNELTKLLSDK